MPAGRRLARHGLPGPAQHRGRDAGDHALPHGERFSRPAPRAGDGLAGGRPALRQLPGVARTGPAQRHGADAGRRPHGQARRRRLDHRDCALPGRTRHPGMRPPRPDAADGARAGRLPGAGQRHRGRRPAQAAGPCAAGGRRRDAGAGDGAGRAGGRAHGRTEALRHHRHRGRPRHRGPGAGAARHAGHEPRPHGEVRAQFHGRRPGIAQALEAYVRAVKDGSFPDDSLHAW